jgi:hypothetical protein
VFSRKITNSILAGAVAIAVGAYVFVNRDFKAADAE